MILLIDGEDGYFSIATALLAPFDAPIERAGDVPAAVERLGRKHFELVLVTLPKSDVDENELAAWLRAALPEPRDVPIVVLADLDGGEGRWIARGFDGMLPLPFDGGAFLSAVGGWLGRSDMQVPADDALDKLTPLMGAEAAAGMIGRLYTSLGEAVAEVEAGGDKRALGHKLGGLAGTLGVMPISAAWLALQDDVEVWPTVRAITREAMALHEVRAVGA